MNNTAFANHLAAMQSATPLMLGHRAATSRPDRHGIPGCPGDGYIRLYATRSPSRTRSGCRAGGTKSATSWLHRWSFRMVRQSWSIAAGSRSRTTRRPPGGSLTPRISHHHRSPASAGGAGDGRRVGSDPGSRPDLAGFVEFCRHQSPAKTNALPDPASLYRAGAGGR